MSPTLEQHRVYNEYILVACSLSGRKLILMIKAFLFEMTHPKEMRSLLEFCQFSSLHYMFYGWRALLWAGKCPLNKSSHFSWYGFTWPVLFHLENVYFHYKLKCVSVDVPSRIVPFLSVYLLWWFHVMTYHIKRTYKPLNWRTDGYTDTT